MNCIKNTCLFLITILGFLGNAHAQKETKNIDFILVINEEVFSQYTDFKFVVYNNGKGENIPVTYWPGNLSISMNDYKKLLHEKTDSIFLEINDDRYIDGNKNDDQYVIEYKKDWLRDTYNILRIYNLDRAEYAKSFWPNTNGRNYVFELDSPVHTFKLIRKTGIINRTYRIR